MTTTVNRGFEIELVRNITVIRFTVERLDQQNFETISEELESLLIFDRPRKVVVDLHSIRRIDDFGLAMFQSFHDSLDEAGGTAILCRLSSLVQSTLNESGLNRMLHIRESYNDAIWTF